MHKAEFKYIESCNELCEKNKSQLSLLKLSTGCRTELVLLSIKEPFAERETKRKTLREGQRETGGQGTE